MATGGMLNKHRWLHRQDDVGGWAVVDIGVSDRWCVRFGAGVV